MKRIHFATCAALAMVHAAPAQPEWKKQLTPVGPGPWPAIAPCTLDYKASWNGMFDAGRLKIEFAPADARKPGALVVRSSAASTGPAAALFPYRSHFWSEINPSTLRPRFFHGVETDRRETLDTTTRYFPNRVETVEIIRPLRDGNAETRRKQEFRHDAVFDIFSAMLHVRGRRLNPGERVNLVVQPFDNPYLVRVTVEARAMHLGRKTIRLRVGMNKIDRRTLALRPYRKMHRDATLWLSDDKDRIPVELRAAAFIGDVRVVLAEIRRH